MTIIKGIGLYLKSRRYYKARFWGLAIYRS